MIKNIGIGFFIVDLILISCRFYNSPNKAGNYEETSSYCFGHDLLHFPHRNNYSPVDGHGVMT